MFIPKPPDSGPLQFITTKDGSNTLFHTGTGEHYHSMNGAVQESRHVFLESGLQYFLTQTDYHSVSVLEVGFGTGLNFLLSAQLCLDNNIQLLYTGIESCPLSREMVGQTGYNNYVSKETWDLYISGYEQALQGEVRLQNNIQLEIVLQAISDFHSVKRFDILYFDAFSARSQPEMWTEKLLGQVCRNLKTNGLFVTYAMNGNLKRNMEALGFSLEKIPGASGKREMLRAKKIDSHST